MQNITIFTKPSSNALVIEKKLKRMLATANVAPKQPIVITIGGDGTTLMAIKQFLHQDVVFVGISAGHLGFLQTLKPKELPLLIDALKTNSFSTIKAPLVAARNITTNTVLGYGFNDIMVERASSRAARFKLHVDENPGTFIGDGVIFATPLGSTAYSLSAGGPIIDSRAQDVLVVSPSNPHVSTLYSSLQRPHVLQKGRVVRISVSKEDAVQRPINLSFDGQSMVRGIGDDFEIYLSNKKIQLLELTQKDFHSRIDKKRLGNF